MYRESRTFVNFLFVVPLINSCFLTVCFFEIIIYLVLFILRNYSIYNYLNFFFLHIICECNCIICVSYIIHTFTIFIPSLTSYKASRKINSEYKLNRSGDRTHPCRTPRFIRISSDIFTCLRFGSNISCLLYSGPDRQFQSLLVFLQVYHVQFFRKPFDN